MLRRYHLLFGLLAAALSATIACEVVWERERWNDLTEGALPGIVPAELVGVVASAVRSEDTSQQHDELVKAILTRPLFSPDRRPHSNASAERPIDTAVPRLAGTVVTAVERRAIFENSPSPIVVIEGGRIGVFSVSHIGNGQVTLLGPGGVRIVRLSRATNRPDTTVLTGRTLSTVRRITEGVASPPTRNASSNGTLPSQGVLPR